MFNGNNSLRGRNDKVEYTREMIEEYVRCQSDIIYFAEKYYYINSVDGRCLIKLFDAQKKILIACTTNAIEPNRKNLAINASRRSYTTTALSIYLLHQLLFEKDNTDAILSNTEKNAMGVLDSIKFAYSMIPLFLQQEVLEWNKHKISLGNGAQLIACSCWCGSVRGYAIKNMVVDNFGYVQPNIQKEFMLNIFPVMGSYPKSKTIISTTPNKNEIFGLLWNDALDNKNSYYPIKIIWSDIPGRDEAWKQNMINNVPGGEKQFERDFECRFI